ncbi:MAG: hypothetical protein NTY76_04960 [Candidatus Omnitrophica bacterium]|nr:hypothetical protein [Candidatus Omnitrophota bacterium]
MNFLKNLKIYRVIASILTVVFFLSTINIDFGYGLQAPLGTTVPAMQLDYQVHYNIELLRGIIDLLERNQFGEATTIQEIRSREVLIVKKLTGLEFEVTDDEVIVKAAGGNIILRYYNPIQAQAYLNDTVNASHLGLDARLNNNLARQVLYSKSLNQRLLNEAKALPPAIEQESITPPAINAEEKTPVNEVTPKSEEIGNASLEMLIRLCGISFATALYGMGYTITGPVVGVIIVGGLALHKKISFNEIAALLALVYTLFLPSGVTNASLNKIATQRHVPMVYSVDNGGTHSIKTVDSAGRIDSALPQVPEGWKATSNPYYAYRVTSSTQGYWTTHTIEVMNLSTQETKVIDHAYSPEDSFEGTPDISPGDDPYIVYGRWDHVSSGNNHRHTLIVNIADTTKQFWLDIYFRSVKFIPNTNFAVITDIKGTKYKVDVTTGKILPILPPAVIQLLLSKGEPLPEYDNSRKYASLPVGKKLSIDDVLALSMATTLIPKGTSAINIGGTISAYLTENIALLKDMAKDDNPILIRLPLEVLIKSDAELVSAWLNKLNSTPNVYIELYSVESPDIIASEEYYSRHGLSGVYNKRFPIDRTKQNTLTLYAVSADIKKSDLATALQISTSLKSSVVVPIGMQDDATGLVRGTLFGFRLIYIARHKDDVDFIKSTVSNYRDLIASYGINPPDLKADNILELFGANIVKIVAVLMSIIRSLPIRPVPTEQIRAVRDHILQSA